MAIATPANRIEEPLGEVRRPLRRSARTHGWARAVGGRVARLLATLLVVSFCTFMLTTLLPGDPARVILGREASPQQVELVRHELGLDRPLLTRYATWLEGVATGDLGVSYRTGLSVGSSIAERLPVTIELLILAEIVALVVAVPAAILAAYKAGGAADMAIGGASFVLLALPPFVMALVLILVFALHAHLFPATGFVPLSDGLGPNLRCMVLPAVALATEQIAVYMRVLRSDLLVTLREDFILLGKAKALSPLQILLRHALRPSSMTLVTIVGLNIGALIGGAVLVESVFALPGVGSLLVQAIAARDYITVQGVTLLVAAGYVLLNFAMDGVYPLLDPRLRNVRR